MALEFGDIHSLAAAAFVTSELLPERSGRGSAAASQPVRTLPVLLTALAASLDRLWNRNALTLHTSSTVQEFIAAEARILESINYEVGDLYAGRLGSCSRRALFP